MAVQWNFFSNVCAVTRKYAAGLIDTFLCATSRLRRRDSISSQPILTGGTAMPTCQLGIIAVSELELADSVSLVPRRLSVLVPPILIVITHPTSSPPSVSDKGGIETNISIYK